MLVAAITGVREASLVERPDPLISQNFALVKVTCAPMCTEFKQYRWGDITDRLGHEAAGEVVEAASDSRVRPGTRVVVMPTYPCGGCSLCHDGDYVHCEHGVDPHALCPTTTGTATYAQFLVKQDWLLLPIPDDLESDEGAMACCGLGPSFGAAQRAGIRRGDSVLVVGLGPVGLGAVITAVDRGATVTALDHNPYRRTLAMDLGASRVVDAGDPQAVQQVRGADVVLECTGLPEAQVTAVASARRRGQVVFVGWGGPLTLDNPIPQGLTLHGQWHWNLRHADELFALIRRNRSAIAKVITHRFPLSRVKEAWELQLTGACGKVMLDPWAA